MRNLRRIAFIRRVKKSFTIIVATIRVCGLISRHFHNLATTKTTKKPITNNNFGEDPQVSCVSKTNEKEVVKKKLPNKEIVQCYYTCATIYKQTYYQCSTPKPQLA